MRIAQVPTTTIPSQIGPIIAMSHLQSSFGSVARVAPYMKRLAMSEKNFPTGAAREAHVPTVTSASQIGPIAAISHLRFSLGRFAFVASWVNDIPRVPG